MASATFKNITGVDGFKSDILQITSQLIQQEVPFQVLLKNDKTKKKELIAIIKYSETVLNIVKSDLEGLSALDLFEEYPEEVTAIVEF